MRGDPSPSLDALLTYYRGVYFATVALKRRLAKLGSQGEQAVREVGRYQRMVKRYWEALEETERLRRERG